MNKKGSFGIAIMTSILILIIGFTILNFVKDEVTRARTNLDCSNAENISDGTKLVCLVVDVAVIYWIIIILSVVIGGITARLTI